LSRTLDKDISYVIEYEAFEGPLENIKKPQFSDEVTYHTYVVDQCKQTEDQNLEKKIKNIIIWLFSLTGFFIQIFSSNIFFSVSLTVDLFLFSNSWIIIFLIFLPSNSGE
jgi:hypothetical protein